MKIKALFDFYTDSLRPMKLIICADRGGFDWSEVLFFPVSGPFESADPYELTDIPGASVLISDLIRRSEEDEQLGINMPAIAERHGPDAEILWLEMSDVEEVMKFVW